MTPVEVHDVATGLWLWRVEHPAWHPDVEWEPLVASTFVESGGETLVLDPLAPPDDASEVWERLDARPPTVVVVLKPDHVRDVDLFVRWYGARAFGPWLFWRDDVPETELEPVQPGMELPGGLVALYDEARTTRRPSGCPNSAPSSLATGSPRRAASYASGRASGTRSEFCRRCTPSSSFPSST